MKLNFKLHHNYWDVFVSEGFSRDGHRLELPVLQLGVPQYSIGEMMDALTPLPAQQCRFLFDEYSISNLLPANDFGVHIEHLVYMYMFVFGW